MTAVLVAIAAACATMLGGSLALKLRDKLHIILGFSAGAVVAVAFFDLLPEALELGGKVHQLSTVVSFAALGFLLYLTLDRIILLHNHAHENGDEHPVESRGHIRAGSLSIHSFLDGVGIGLAFQVSAAVGAVVAAAVLAHDFSDGINTVNVVVRHGGERSKALRWLLVDALAPVLGVIVTLFFTLSEDSLGLLLAMFAGFFLYIGASDLIPESHHQHPKFLTTLMTLIGAAVLYLAIHFAG
ncbi:MAG: ZIP family metal transporter [Patescibacteria group bacterium]|nr:ZIP family metal transporter [Patescibacteria group bacterium]